MMNNRIFQGMCFWWLDTTRNGNKAFYREKTNRIKKANKKCRIFLMNTPEYANLGDQLIAVAENGFLKDMFPTTPVYEITQTHLLIDWEGIVGLIREDDLILITGGGFMGTIWKYAEELVQKIVTSFSCPIIILPQTSFFSNDINGEHLYVTAKNIYRTNPNLYAIARDEATYKIFVDFIGKEKSMLLPDMAFYAVKNLSIPPVEAKSGIKICFRTDNESIMKKDTCDKIFDCVAQIGIKHECIDTVMKNNVLFCENRYEEVCKMAASIGETQLLITDRLHAMVFAILTNTPCIAFDNLSRKISGVYNVLSKTEKIKNVTLIDVKDADYIDYDVLIQKMLKERKLTKNEMDVDTIYAPLKRMIEDLI